MIILLNLCLQTNKKVELRLDILKFKLSQFMDRFICSNRWNGESEFLTACYWVCDCDDDEIRSFSEISRCINLEPGPIFADIEGFIPKAQQNCFSNKPQLPLKVFHKS